jgi:hypothetical protein
MDNLQFKNWFIIENDDIQKKQTLEDVKGLLGLLGLDDAQAANTKLGNIKGEKNVGRGVTRQESWKEKLELLQRYRALKDGDPKKTAIMNLNTGNTVNDLVDAFNS